MLDLFSSVSNEMSSVQRSILNNGLANIAQKLVRIADQLLLVPFFLVAWGAQYYGEWLTLSIVPSILAFSDLGFGSAVSNGFVLAYASGDKQGAANLYRSGFIVISASVLLGTLLTGLVVYLGDCAGWFAKSAIDATDAVMAVTMMMASKLISFYTQLAEAFYRGARRAATGSFFSSGNSLLNIIVSIIILYSGCGVVGIALSNFIIAIIYTSIFWYVGRRMIAFDGHSGIVKRSDIRMIITKGMGYFATPVWQSIYFQGTTFVVRIVLGAEAVAMFNTVRTVCRSVNQVFSIINAAIFPDLQYEYGRGNLPLVRKIFRMAVDISVVIGFIGACILCLIGLDLYNWWTHNTLSVTRSVWYIFMIGVFMNAVWWTSVITYRMTNRPKHFAIVSILMSCVSVLVCYFAADIYGLWGAALATTVFEAAMAIFILPDSCRLLGLRGNQLFHFREDWTDIRNRFKRKKK